MYRRVLVPLEISDADQAILDHIRLLARSCHASVVLIHVADGWVARNIQPLALRESEEMREDRAYLERIAAGLRADEIETDALLAGGDPAKEIAAAAEREGCDLIAMSTHGHRYLADLIYGSVANQVRHISMVPVLLVRCPAPAKPKPEVADSESQPAAGGGSV